MVSWASFQRPSCAKVQGHSLPLPRPSNQASDAKSESGKNVGMWTPLDDHAGNGEQEASLWILI